MASGAEWAEGYRRQAEADLRAAQAVLSVEPSVFAMLMQMAFEKLGKAALLRSGAISLERARSTHAAGTDMVRAIGRNRWKAERLGYNVRTLSQHLALLVSHLEDLHPSNVRRRGGEGPWLEYPWVDAAGELRWPARDLPGLPDFGARNAPKVIQLVSLAEAVCRHFDEIFPN